MNSSNRGRLPDGWTVVSINGWCYLRKDGPMVEYATLGPDVRWPRVIGISSAISLLVLFVAAVA